MPCFARLFGAASHPRRALLVASSLFVAACRLADDDPIVTAGSVLDSSGSPVPNAVVTIEAGTQRDPKVVAEFDGEFAFDWSPVTRVKADAQGVFVFEALRQFFAWQPLRWVAPPHRSGTTSTLVGGGSGDLTLVPLVQWDAHVEMSSPNAVRLVVAQEYPVVPGGPPALRELVVSAGTEVVWREPFVDNTSRIPPTILAGRAAPVAFGYVWSAGQKERRSILGDYFADHWRSSWQTGPLALTPPAGWKRVEGLRCIEPSMEPCTFADGQVTQASRPDIETREPVHSDWTAPIVLALASSAHVHAVVVHGAHVDLLRSWYLLPVGGGPLPPETPDRIIVDAAPASPTTPEDSAWSELASWRLPSPPTWTAENHTSQEDTQAIAFASEVAGRYLQAELPDDREVGWVRVRAVDQTGAPTNLYGLAELTLVTQ